MRPRRRSSPRGNHAGFVLIALIALLAMGGLYFFVSNLSSEFIQARRQQQTGDALQQAREALLGYAVRFRELNPRSSDNALVEVYGYLPLPDLGSSRNNNVSCTGEGCDAANFTGNAANTTVIGRFPWSTLGTGPLRDSHGECLWYAVSGSHQRIQKSSPMNWDTLGQIDIVVANGTSAMVSAISSAHDRPIAVIFSPGPALTGQDRSTSTTDTVTECGGNYVVSNYLDPVVASELAGVTNYLAGTTNSASGDTSTTNKSLATNGVINLHSDGSLSAGNCSDDTACSIVVNDTAATVTSELLFRHLRGSSYFRTDINAMLDRMTTCLRDQVAAGTGFTPDALSGFTAPTDKTVGRIPSSSCYDDTQPPLGYFSHYQDQVFVAAKLASDFTVTVDGSAQTCPAAIVFAGQRDSGQSRSTTAERNTPANYLEGSNLAGFTTTGALSFTGPSLLAKVSSSQTASQDIVRCVASGANLTVVESAGLTAAQQLVAYDAATSTLTLGKQDVINTTAGASNLYGCAWSPDEKSLGSGLRSYFQFTFYTLGTNVGNTGFVFALIDSESNPISVAADYPCGKAGNHLGYSGDNGSTPNLAFPKIGIEFDQARNANFSESATGTNPGRLDPCYLSSCGANPAQTASSHAGIVYWGHETANATDAVTIPDDDDNVHGFPSAASIATVRRPPKNPDASPGVEFVNLRTGGQLFHVRVELTPTRSVDAAAAETSKTSMQTKVWILADSTTVANQITAMQDTTRPMSELYASFTETLSDTANVFDVAGSACSAGTCPANQTCGTDNVCYRQGMRLVRLGFTNSQRTQDQSITIGKMFSTWLP